MFSATMRLKFGGWWARLPVSARTKPSSSSRASSRLKRRSKPIVVTGFSLIPAPPQSDPPMCPGQTSAKSPSARSRFSEAKSPRAPSSGSTARSGRATSPTKSESPVTTSHGSSPRLPSATRYAVCSGRCPGVVSAVIVTSPTVTVSPSAIGSCSNSTPAVAGTWMIAPVAFARRALAADVVGVVVRLEDVRDAEAVLLGELEVGLDVPFRVDDRRLAPVGDDVGRAPEILVQHLPEEHFAPG